MEVGEVGPSELHSDAVLPHCLRNGLRFGEWGDGGLVGVEVKLDGLEEELVVGQEELRVRLGEEPTKKDSPCLGLHLTYHL